MRAHVTTALIVLCVAIAACGSKRSRSTVSPEVRAAKLAETKATWAARTTVNVNGQPFDVGVSADKTFVLVGPASPSSEFTVNNIEAAGQIASGCPTNMGGFVKGVIGPDVVLPVKDAEFLRAKIDCSPRAVAQAEFRSRGLFDNYPQAETTYLSFSKQHGFQVNYIASNGKAWLWYPGNTGGVAEEWKLDTERDAICWRHPSNTYNPVTKTTGGKFQCQNRSLSISTIVSSQPGDPYNLASGSVPNRRDKCSAPSEFNFDRTLFGC